MHCIVTAGPTFEPLDQVRRLTNFSTGKLGTRLAQFLASANHKVVLLRGEASIFSEQVSGAPIELFTTTSDLANRLEKNAGPAVEAIFHTAAVSDFRFGRVLRGDNAGPMQEVRAGKLPTRTPSEETHAGNEGMISYYAELIPTAKIIASLRGWFPNAWIVGWKYEVDGAQDETIAKGRAQIVANETNACVVNGPAYGEGFGLVHANGKLIHAASDSELFEYLQNARTIFADRRHEL